MNVGVVFGIEVSGGHAWTRVEVSGELDLCTAPVLHQALARERAAGRPTILDLSDITFVDSAGLVEVMDAITAAQENGWHFGIAAHLSPAVTRTARIAGVLAQLPLVEQ